MSYTPLFDVIDNKGFAGLCNFAPNNWEKTNVGRKYVASFMTDGQKWITRSLGSLDQDEFLNLDSSNFEMLNTHEANGVFISEICLLDLRVDEVVNERIDELPNSGLSGTHWPEWRSTIGFRNSGSQVSYQGEINPFPPKASLLTFHPFIQYNEVDNYLVFLNAEKSPIHRWAELEIFTASNRKRVGTHRVRNNAANIIPLNKFGFEPNDLPVIQCHNMAGIPFGLGIGQKSNMLSFEHTHPPGSLTLHGNRWGNQKLIKMGWSDYLNEA